MEPQTSIAGGMGRALGNAMEGGRRFTTEDVEAARQKEREANIKLMDDMEASVSTQGQWFIKIGEKTPITETKQVTESRGLFGRRKTLVDEEVTTGYEDTRLLILKTESNVSTFLPEQEQQEFTVVTADGILVAAFWESEINHQEVLTYPMREIAAVYERLKNLVSGTRPSTEGMRYTNGRLTIGNVIAKLSSPNEYGKRFDVEAFQERIQESISHVESPHKANLEAANKNTELATSASSLIRSLPPRE